MVQLSGKPADLDEMLDGPELLIAGEDGRIDPLGRRHTESIGIGDRVLAFNVGRCPYQREVQGPVPAVTALVGAEPPPPWPPRRGA